MDTMMSQFIDDELGIDEKLEFIHKIQHNDQFRSGLVGLLHQERILRSDVVHTIPPVSFGGAPKAFRFRWRPLRILAPALTGALIVFFFMMPSRESIPIPHRFIIYQPEATQVAITGNFTGWKTVPMNRTGSGEYWEITLNLPKGEHRFTYLLDGIQRLADPTILAKERDDFGGENSILTVDI